MIVLNKYFCINKEINEGNMEFQGQRVCVFQTLLSDLR